MFFSPWRKWSDQFIKLEDVASRFRKPCILDVKVGRRVWDDFAERDKIEREKKKCPPQEILGFRIIGMRVSEQNWCFWLWPSFPTLNFEVVKVVEKTILGGGVLRIFQPLNCSFFDFSPTSGLSERHKWLCLFQQGVWSQCVCQRSIRRWVTSTIKSEIVWFES